MDSGSANRRHEIIDGLKHFFSEKISYSFLHAIIILVVVSISLYNLTFQTGDTQLWRDLLLFTFGLVIPAPQNKQINV